MVVGPVPDPAARLARTAQPAGPCSCCRSCAATEIRCHFSLRCKHWRDDGGRRLWEWRRRRQRRRNRFRQHGTHHRRQQRAPILRPLELVAQVVQPGRLPVRCGSRVRYHVSDFDQRAQRLAHIGQVLVERVRDLHGADVGRFRHQLVNHLVVHRNLSRGRPGAGTSLKILLRLGGVAYYFSTANTSPAPTHGAATSAAIISKHQRLQIGCGLYRGSFITLSP